jgi:hypothetical protein
MGPTVAMPTARFGRIEQTRRVNSRFVALVAMTITGLLAVVTFIGADARWLSALGGEIADGHGLPAGLPFAPAASPSWPNPLVLAELTFHALVSAFGERGLMLAQLAAVAVAAAVLTRDAIAGNATHRGAAAAVMVGAVGALPDLATVRVQLFSLALFPICGALLRREARNPTRRIWLLVPLLALWSNLHGGALVGLGVTMAYLGLARARHDVRTASAVAVAALAATCINPAGLSTVSYYSGVLTNVAAARGEGQWTPLSLTSGLDLLLLGAALVLALQALRSRPRTWEMVVIAALALMTVKASRSGVWLLLFLVPLAARSFKPRAIWERLLPALATTSILALALGIVRGPLNPGASDALIAQAVALSRGTPVLAEDVLAEQVALAGGRIWAGNPLDAFPKSVQAEYLDWVSGEPSGARALSSQIRVVLVGRDAPALALVRRDLNYRMLASDRTTELYVRFDSS